MNFRYAETMIDFYYAYETIKGIGTNYPDFHYWFWNKVVTGVSLGEDKIIMGYHKNDLVGVSIIKDTPTEKKLRAVRIQDTFQQKGYGLHLIDRSLKDLNDDKPICSVAETMINDFSRIFVNRYDFDLVRVHKGLYLPRTLEYQFNGTKESLTKTELNN